MEVSEGLQGNGEWQNGESFAMMRAAVVVATAFVDNEWGCGVMLCCVCC